MLSQGAVHHWSIQDSSILLSFAKFIKLCLLGLTKHKVIRPGLQLLLDLVGWAWASQNPSKSYLALPHGLEFQLVPCALTKLGIAAIEVQHSA